MEVFGYMGFIFALLAFAEVTNVDKKNKELEKKIEELESLTKKEKDSQQ